MQPFFLSKQFWINIMCGQKNLTFFFVSFMCSFLIAKHEHMKQKLSKFHLGGWCFLN